MTWYYFRLECLRMLRDPRYLAMAVITPVGFYLLFATIFGKDPAKPGELKGTIEIMVAMAAYGGIWGALSATGPRIAHERSSGWLEQLRSMPLATRQVMAAKLAAGMVVALPALLLVCATGAAFKGVGLDAWQWAAMAAAMWVGCLPFALLGIAIGYAVGGETAFPLSYAVYLAMSILGGLWVPPSVLPASFRTVADALPTYRLADLGWHIAGGGAPAAADVAVLAGWTVGLGLLATWVYRRPRRSAAAAA
ncbi:ABC transporter permease [Actinospica sp.]|uniref:ABC transporter permease n=1 Tax=Actinospica sp. TaxID=1872142 RepID=UPI002BB7E5DA|nr:ABC transporter permease [Actinospica sp.]HWG25881.1 ABC transporter permease [Actinospica sp.]